MRSGRERYGFDPAPSTRSPPPGTDPPADRSAATPRSIPRTPGSPNDERAPTARASTKSVSPGRPPIPGMSIPGQPPRVRRRHPIRPPQLPMDPADPRTRPGHHRRGLQRSQPARAGRARAVGRPSGPSPWRAKRCGTHERVRPSTASRHSSSPVKPTTTRESRAASPTAHVSRSTPRIRAARGRRSLRSGPATVPTGPGTSSPDAGSECHRRQRVCCLSCRRGGSRAPAGPAAFPRPCLCVPAWGRATRISR
ncbi:hypothetical protein EHYA_04766 [Embleya hyalina]|uniref:Uncharacterized protein n=1 Tax=Embleya hyalina TaxID=516124 RepID=A0A401YR51_9ACTN|nr:hypothetical protein EHYA_04766 [Embleya hyalina]